MTGEEKERSRIAKELHDGIGSLLAASKMHASKLLSQSPDIVSPLIHMLDNASKETRRISHNLLPESLLNKGLDIALQDFISSINESQLIKAEYQSINLSSELPQSTQLTIYRIIQELFNNIIKHSNATEAMVQLNQHNTKLLITVEDNGKGFSYSNGNNGIGLQNIKSRLSLLNGKMEVDSKETMGTSVYIEFELDKKMNQLYKVAVLDDHDLIAQAIKSMLESHKTYKFIGGFTTFSECVKHINEINSFDILLLDINLKNEDGIEICKKLNNNFPEIHKIMLTSLTQQSLISEALKNGAKGYLTKNVSYTDLIEAFDSVLKGKIYLHQDISFVPSVERNKFTDNYLPKLTRREKEILTLILEEYTTQEIGDKLFITVSTVETHRSSLLLKTGSKNVVGLIKYTLQKGLLSSS